MYEVLVTILLVLHLMSFNYYIILHCTIINFRVKKIRHRAIKTGKVMKQGGCETSVALVADISKPKSKPVNALESKKMKLKNYQSQTANEPFPNKAST